MSSSAPSRSRGGRGRGRGYQQKFVPRGAGAVVSTTSTTTSTSTTPPSAAAAATATAAQTSSDNGSKQPRPRFTASLRSPPQADLSKGDVKDEEKGARRAFIPYLPQDEAMASGICEESGGLDAVFSQLAVDALNDGLSWLLRLNPRQFWKEVATNESLQNSLDCYLRFRYRWYDFPHHGPKGAVAGVIVGERELSRRVFMTLYRISSRKDPGAEAHDCLSAKEHADLLQAKNLLDLPKLLEICAIYGHGNEELTRVLISNAMKVQPKLSEDLSSACYNFLRIADTLHKRCSSVIETLTVSDSQRDFEHKRLSLELLEVLDFINDAVVTLDAFIDAYRPAAPYFCHPADFSQGSEDMFKTLGRLHDSLLLSLKQGFSFFSTGKRGNSSADCSPENVDFCLKTLSVRVTKFGWRLLDICHLSNSSLDDGSQTANNLIPLQVDDPITRGNMLVQMLKSIHSEMDNHLSQNQEYGAFLQNMEKNHSVLNRIEDLRASGCIFVDDEQYQYLAQMLMPFISNVREETKVPTSVTDKETLDENTIIMESKISQIKDLFPDYGRGFLFACLEVYNENPEEVIQRILEGTLHEDLLSLDHSQEQIPRPSTVSKSVVGKGKGLLVEPEEKRKDKGKGLLIDAPSPPWSSVDHSGGKVNVEMSTSYVNGRYSRKSNTEDTTEVLDSRSAKDSIRSAILAAAEYDDEYDDSFDDLGLSVVETTEEVQALAEGVGSLPGRARSHSEPQQNLTKWASQKKTQFYVKDGKNYSYKVSGSVAVSNANEAAIIHQAQKDLIYGLGRGGNIPLGAAERLNELVHRVPDDSDISKDGNERGNIKSWGRGRRQGNYNGDGRSGDSSVEGNTKAEVAVELPNTMDGGGRGNPNSRGRGGRGGRNHNRKNQAMKKHFVGLTGY